MSSRKKTKKIDNKKFPWRLLYFYLHIWAIDTFANSMTVLTKYPPFSLISDNYIFHHNNLKMLEIKKVIYKAFPVLAMYQDRDQYFWYLYFDKTKIPINKLRQIVDKEVLVNEDGDYVKVLIPRE